MVYFIQYGADGPIKIGMARLPYHRLKELQPGAPEHLHLLGAIEGGLGLEKQLHKIHAEDRFRGEWFRPSPELLAAIARYLEGDVPSVDELFRAYDAARRTRLVALPGEPEVPDVLGAAELAGVMGVCVQTLWKMRRRGDLPEPCVVLKATPVWHRRNVEGAAHVEPLALLGTAEAAALLEVDKSQIGRWGRIGRFPQPCLRLVATPLWWEKTITNWAKAAFSGVAAKPSESTM